MNLLKSLTGYLMGSSGGSESLVQISGSLYDRYKGNWRCLINESAAVVQKSATAFHYDLIINNEANEVVEDYSQEEEEQTYEFSIAEELVFAEDEGPITTGFSWTDTKTGKRYPIHFIKTHTYQTHINHTFQTHSNIHFKTLSLVVRYLLELDNDSNMYSLFKLTVCQCIYEAKHNKPSSTVPSEVLLKLCGAPPQEPSPSTPLYPSLKEEPKTPSSPYTASYVSQGNTPQRTPQQPAQPVTLRTPQQTTPQQVKGTPQQTTATPQAKGTPQQAKTPQQATPQQTTATPQAKPTPQQAKTPQQATPQQTTPRKTPKNQFQQGTPTQVTPQSSFMNKLQETTPEEAPKSTAPGLSIEGDEYTHISGVELFAFDQASGNFIMKQPYPVDIAIHYTGDEEVLSYKLYVLDKGVVTIAQALNNDMNGHHNKEEESFIWSYTLGSIVWMWSVKFLKHEDYEQFVEAFAIALWEVNNNSEFKQKKGDTTELEYMINAFSDNPSNPNDISLEHNDGKIDEVDLMEFDAMNLDDKEEEEEESEDEESEEEDDDAEEDDDSESEAVKDFNSHSHNSALAVGTRNARSFVVRGSQIGVFKTDGNLKLDTMIKKIKDKEGKFFSPKKLVLSEQDQSLLMLNPSQKNKLFKMDLNRSDVVEEWKVSDYYPVAEVLPTTKYAQTTPAKTVVGMNDNGFFLIDPRLNKEKMVESKSYFYSGDKNPQLACAATTDTGAMVVGTKRGDIRLFDAKTFGEGRASAADSLEARRPRAKTTLPGLGDPIIGIDVTEDGRWILATCRTYVLVIPTELPGGSNGFEKSMGKYKPVPRRLQLKREDLIKMGGKVSFTVAKFNTKDPTNPNAPPERSIVTSSGRFVITWNFKKVKQGICDQYNIQEYEDVVVADQFKFGQDEKVIVTLPNNVHLSKRSVRKVI